MQPVQSHELADYSIARLRRVANELPRSDPWACAEECDRESSKSPWSIAVTQEGSEGTLLSTTSTWRGLPSPDHAHLTKPDAERS